MQRKAPVSVLIIEDDIRTRVTLENLLEDAGYLTECARTGNEGVKKILKNGFKVAIIDIRLPDTNGLNILRILKEYSKSICAVMVTSYPSVEDAVKALKLGAHEYLEKPLDLGRIVEIIDKAAGDIHIPKRRGTHNSAYTKKEST